jgi:hypothetical protein
MKIGMATRAEDGPTAPIPSDGGHYHYLLSRRERALRTASPAARARILGERPTYERAVSHCIVIDLRSGNRTVTNTTPLEVKTREWPPKLLGAREMVAADLGDPALIAFSGKRAGPREIIAACARAWEVSIPAMLGAGRAGGLARPRFAAMWIIRDELGQTTLQIGRLFGGRDHTTTMNALHRAKYLYQHDTDWRQRYACARFMLFGNE